jgi:hypothetical protein
MPRSRRKTLAHRYGLDSPRAREQLLSGHDWPFLDGRALDDAELAQLWDDLRDELTELHVRGAPAGANHWAEHAISPKPFTRPWAWWWFDAPEPLRDFGGEQKPDSYTPGRIGYLQFGLSHPFWTIGSQQESQLDYLKRLDLLTDYEQDLLKAAEKQE